MRKVVVKAVGVGLMNVKSAIGVRPRPYILLEAACCLALIALGRLLKKKNSLLLRETVMHKPDTSWNSQLGLFRFDASTGQFSFINVASAGDVVQG